MPTRSSGACCYEAYNDWLIDFCAAKPERLIGVAQLSMEDPEAARDELERLAKRGGLRHVNILASRANPPVYDDAWEPFWTLAEEVAIPIGFHLAVLVKKTRLDAGDPSGANPAIAIASRFAKEPPGVQLLEPITGLIFAGVLDRHPGVKIVMAEAGLAWIPSMIQGLDIWYQRSRDGRRLSGDGPIALPKLLPSEYFQRQIWISFVDDPLGVRMVGRRPRPRQSDVWFRLSASGEHLAVLAANHRGASASSIGRRAAENLSR